MNANSERTPIDTYTSIPTQPALLSEREMATRGRKEWDKNQPLKMINARNAPRPHMCPREVVYHLPGLTCLSAIMRLLSDVA